MRNKDITPEDRELYEEVFGVPFNNTYGRQGTELLDYKYRIPRDELDNEIDLMKRANETVIDFLMGTSGIVKELVDSDYIERMQESPGHSGKNI